MVLGLVRSELVLLSLSCRIFVLSVPLLILIDLV